MKKQITHVVINYILLENISKNGNLIKDGCISVGVTDNVRWQNAINCGDSGVDELTWMTAIMQETGTQDKGYAPNWSIDFFSFHPTEPIFALMHQYMTELLEIAHKIRDENLTQTQAREQFIGYHLTKKSSDYDTQAYF